MYYKCGLYYIYIYFWFASNIPFRFSTYTCNYFKKKCLSLYLFKLSISVNPVQKAVHPCIHIRVASPAWYTPWHKSHQSVAQAHQGTTRVSMTGSLTISNERADLTLIDRIWIHSRLTIFIWNSAQIQELQIIRYTSTVLQCTPAGQEDVNTVFWVYFWKPDCWNSGVREVYRGGGS